MRKHILQYMLLISVSLFLSKKNNNVMYFLGKIIFGTGLKTGGVFWDSKYIKEIHCRSTIPPSIIGFNNEVYNNATLYVPKGCNEAYHTAIMWREFKTIVEE